MKKLITLLIAFISLSAFAQTSSVVTRNVLSNLDTDRITTTTVISVKHDTLKYKAPASTYIASSPIVYSGVSGKTISNLSFNGNGNATVLLQLKNCNNIHVTLCKFYNTNAFAIDLQNCTNITIDNCYFNLIQTGVRALSSTGIKVNNNQLLNLWNPVWNNYAYSHAVQFNGVYGGGNQINYNRIENIAGVAVHPHDVLSVYHSSGIQGDSIQVIGNWIRGGQLSYWPTANAGACGIVLGDQYGSYQVARGNILVNPGAGGIANIANKPDLGVSLGIKIDHNQIYSKSTPVTGQAIGVINTNITNVGYNKVNWTNSTGGNAINSSPYSQFWLSNSPIPLNWNTNVWVDLKEITPAILPTTIITMK